jgi:hypothetical protein
MRSTSWSISALLSPKLLHSLACKSGSTIYPATATFLHIIRPGRFDQYHLEQQESLIYQHSNEHLYIRQNQVALDT